MNIAIVEKTHFEVAYTLLRLFDNGKNKITVFAPQETCRQLQLSPGINTDQYTWIMQQHNEFNRPFIKRAFNYIGSHPFDLLFLSTIEDNFGSYALALNRVKNISSILTLHDINSFFSNRLSLNPRRLINTMGKRRLLKLVSNISVLADPLAIYAEKKIKGSKQVYTIPGSFFSEEHYQEKNYNPGETIRIVVPGSVDTRRRNYQQVFDFLQLINQEKLAVSVRLLGGFTPQHSEKILSQCRSYSQPNSNLLYQESSVDQPEFDKHIKDAHFIWSPLCGSISKKDGIVENLGESTYSGNFGDIIRHAKPSFIPQGIATDQPLEKSLLRYEGINDIINILNTLTGEGYHQYQQQSLQASLHYTTEKIRARNSALFMR